MNSVLRQICRFATVVPLSFCPATEPTPTGKKASPEGPTPQPTVIESTSLEMHSTDTETIAIFDRNVMVTGTNLKITCDHLVVVATRVGNTTETVAKLDQFKSLVATGRVRIIQGDREVTCGRAEVLPLEEKIVLTESPVVIDHSGPYIERGTRITLLRGQRKVLVENSVFQGPAILDLGFDKKEPAKAPTPTPANPPSSP